MNKKVLGVILISLISVHTFALFSICTLYTAYASTDTYSVENVIYFNATAMSSAERTYCIKVSPETQFISGEQQWQKGSPLGPTKDISPDQFTPSETTKQRFVATDEHLNAQSVELNGVSFNLSATQWAVLSIYSNDTMAENLSDYNTHFSPTTLYYPAEETVLLFDSPLNYVQQYCDANGLVLTEVLNSTYLEDFDISGLNLFRASLIKNEYFVTEELPEYDDVMALNRAFYQYGGDLRNPWVIGAVIAAVVAVVGFLIYEVMDYFKYVKRCDTSLAGLKYSEDKTYNATIEAINAEKEVQLSLIGSKTEIENSILEAYFNGTISFEECQALLRDVGGDYSSLLDNRTQNIQQILDDYYASIADQFDNFQNGLGIASSWGSWLQYILIIACVLFAMYIVYALVNKKYRTPVNPNVVVVK